MTYLLTQEKVIANSHALPAFPRVIEQILATLDDPDASLNVLTSHIEHDPIVAGNVLSLANRAGMRRQGGAAVNDVFTAISLIGLARVRETAIMSSLTGFLDALAPAGRLSDFWEHSVAVGVCSVELVHDTSIPIPVDAALIAGLLHDVGQLWLLRFEAEKFNKAWNDAFERGVAIDVPEREQFGVDHARIGAWLAENWGLSSNIVSAIAHHHDPDAELAEPLVAVVHVAEVLSHALDLSNTANNRVTAISAASCALLGLTWGDETRPLFGHIDARSRHARTFFQPNAQH